MKVRYAGESNIRHEDKLVMPGDEIELEDFEAEAAIASGLFEEIKKKVKKAKTVDKPEAETKEGAE